MSTTGLFVRGILARDLGRFTDADPIDTSHRATEPQAPFTPAVNETGANARFMPLDPLANGKPFFQKEALEAITQPTGIGDINSDAKGSGARFNNGKPDLSLIPLTTLGASLDRPHDVMGGPGMALFSLGDYQRTQDTKFLFDVLDCLGLGRDGWEECAHVFAYGKRKYAAWNWAKGMPWSVPLACAARHLLAMTAGEETDPESGLPHRGHVFCNIVMLLQYAKTYTEGNDLPPKGLL